MRQVWISRAGPPEVLELREERDPLPARAELRIRVEACGVNYADVIGRMGQYPDLPKLPVVPGYEVAGRIDSVGNDVETDWIGRDVLALTRFGGYSDVVCVPEAQVMARPPGMGAEEGAALPINYLTAYQLIEVMGGLKAGDTVLIHSAGGGVGVAAVQLARRLGARAIGTASEAKHEFLRSIGVEHCIDYTRENFEPRVRQLTDGRGVELALDAVGGRSFRRSYRCLSPTGRLGMYGLSAASPGKRRSYFSMARALIPTLRLGFRPLALMDANKGVFGVNLGHLWDEMDRISTWLERLVGYYRAGEIQPVIDQTFPLEDAAGAHHRLQDRRNLGKVLLRC